MYLSFIVFVVKRVDVFDSRVRILADKDPLSDVREDGLLLAYAMVREA